MCALDFEILLNLPSFPKIVGLKSFSNSWAICIYLFFGDNNLVPLLL